MRCFADVEVGAERLFDDHAALAAVFVGQAGAAKLLDGGLVELRRSGQVVNPRAAGRLFDVIQQFGERDEIFGTADIAGMIVDVLRKLVPQAGVEIAADVAGDSLRQIAAPGIVRERGSREADDSRFLRQPTLAKQVIQRGHQLAMRQIAGGAENDESVGHVRRGKGEVGEVGGILQK